MKEIIRKFVLELIIKIIKKYFNDGLTPIFGRGDSLEIIAYNWKFYDPIYIKRKSKK